MKTKCTICKNRKREKKCAGGYCSVCHNLMMWVFQNRKRSRKELRDYIEVLHNKAEILKNTRSDSTPVKLLTELGIKHQQCYVSFINNHRRETASQRNERLHKINMHTTAGLKILTASDLTNREIVEGVIKKHEN